MFSSPLFHPLSQVLGLSNELSRRQDEEKRQAAEIARLNADVSRVTADLTATRRKLAVKKALLDSLGESRLQQRPDADRGLARQTFLLHSMPLW
jgi:septal ring factor EnvC (AmiA/AmiB activator)